MRYTMTITANHDMSEDEQMEVIDVLGDNYDSATMTKRSIEVDGAIPGDSINGHYWLGRWTGTLARMGFLASADAHVETTI